jgi:hypothetical protein
MRLVQHVDVQVHINGEKEALVQAKSVHVQSGSKERWDVYYKSVLGLLTLYPFNRGSAGVGEE